LFKTTYHSILIRIVQLLTADFYLFPVLIQLFIASKASHFALEYPTFTLFEVLPETPVLSCTALVSLDSAWTTLSLDNSSASSIYSISTASSRTTLLPCHITVLQASLYLPSSRIRLSGKFTRFHELVTACLETSLDLITKIVGVFIDLI